MMVRRFLEEHHVPYQPLDHEPAYDAQRIAHAVHVSGREFAKAVLLRADDGYVLAVLPASRSVDLDRVQRVLGAEHVALASEPECGACFPDCELGALPPFGSQYNMRTLVDRSLLDEDEIVFEGNTHHEAIRMKCQDYLALEKPQVAEFARPY
jgi:Ala-tRNA(Pro) deacylase